MADEGEDNLAGESSAGKWILIALRGALHRRVALFHI